MRDSKINYVFSIFSPGFKEYARIFHIFLTALLLNACASSTSLIEHASNSPDSSGAQHTGTTKPNPPKKSTLEGIDVSHFQGNIDWPQVKRAGIMFVFIKATQGQHTVDQKFEYNHTALEQLHMPWGVYHYLDPDVDPNAQANHFINTVGDHIGHFPPVVDIEAFEHQSIEKTRAVLETYITLIEKYYNCKPIIYTAPGFWNKLEDHEYGRYGLWLANYAPVPTIPKGWKTWLFWQYSSQSTVSGINAEVDLNKFNGDLAGLNSLKCENVPTISSW